VEWGVPFADLGISAGQPLRLYIASRTGESESDTTGEVQWSPADALGPLLLAGIVCGASAWLAKRKSSR
jgi:hypothetical protein